MGKRSVKAVRRMLAKGMAFLLALAFVLGAVPGFDSVVYADGDEIEYTWESDSILNDDGSTTEIIRWLENGVVTSIEEITTSADGLTEVTVGKDADGNVGYIMETVRNGSTTTTVVKDAEGNAESVMETVTNGLVTTTVEKDGDGNVRYSSETTTSEDGTEVTTVEVFAEGRWTKRTEKSDEEGNLLWTLSEFSSPEEDGTCTTVQEKQDGQGEMIYRVETATDADGTVISMETTTRNEDGTMTGILTVVEDGYTVTTVKTYNVEGSVVHVEETTTDENGITLGKEIYDCNEDGTTTTTYTYYDEDGAVTGSSISYTNEEGLTVRDESFDAEGNLYEVQTYTVETDEAGNMISTESIYDADGVKIHESQMIINKDLTSMVSIEKDGEGKVLQTVSLLMERDENGNYIRTETMQDENGEVVQYEKTYFDAEMNQTGRVYEYTYEDAEGNQTFVSGEDDGDDNTLRYAETVKDNDGKIISQYEDLYHEDGTHTHIEAELENGALTGSTETTYQDGVGIKEVTKDSNGEVTMTVLSEQSRDEQGNIVYMSVTYDGTGKKTEETVSTFNSEWNRVDIVNKDGDGNLKKSYSYQSSKDENGNRTATMIETDGEGNQTTTVLQYDSQNNSTSTAVTKDANGNETKREESYFSVADNLEARVERSDAVEFEVSNLNLELAKSLLTSEELSAYEAGSSIVLCVEARSAENTVTAQEAEQIAKAVKEYGSYVSGIRYFDLSVYKNVTGSDVKVTDMGSGALSMKMVIPEEIRNTDPTIQRTFYLMRLHDGKAVLLGKTLGDEFNFTSGLFSVYAISYMDQQVNTENPVASVTEGSVATAQTAAAVVVSPKTGETNWGLLLILPAGLLFACSIWGIRKNKCAGLGESK